MAGQDTHRVTSFIHETHFDDLPDDVLHQTRRCLLDLVGVAAAGTRTPLSEIMRNHAHSQAPAGTHAPRLLFDGRRVGAAHAALANAATIDSMDGHDGHRLTKGHAGAAVLPGVLAFVDGKEETSIRELLTALAIGYEIALRAGIALHRTAADYHSSGAWNSLGAAAAAVRLLGLDRDASWHALGIAEYSSPRAPMMRAIDHPTMVKDSSAWGAQAGVSSTLLAADGFTGAPADLMTEPEMADLGSRWRTLEQYFKPYPVCRWAQPAVQAMLSLLEQSSLKVEQIAHIEVATFEAATRLAAREPLTTEEAQYSLPFPVALAAVHRQLTPDLLLDPRANPEVRRLAAGMKLVEDRAMTAKFPAVCEAEVTVVVQDGHRFASGTFNADGDPEAPLSDSRLLDKFGLYTKELGEPRSKRLAELILGSEDESATELVDLLMQPLRFSCP
ncbi:MAG: MmgE/PrpD family protein [Actinomycetota bacterium]|nr:MmgE/PrpD family protein [Actinomycetota bacterium]